MTIDQMRLHLVAAERENTRQLALHAGAVSLAIGVSFGDDACRKQILDMQT